MRWCECRIGLLLLASPLSGYLAPGSVPIHAPVPGGGAGPQTQRWALNDTLALVLSQPYGRFTTVDQPAATLWRRAVLHGRRGYTQLLDKDPLFYSSAGMATSARQGVLRLCVWRNLDSPPPRSGGAPVLLAYSDFVYLTWDVRFRTWAVYLTQDLEELPTLDQRVGFVGGYHAGQGATYYLLPHWLARERARALRTHRLPPAKQLAAYLRLSRDTAATFGGLLPRPYRPLLGQVLRAYAACPMPRATARQVAQARQALAAGRP